VVASQNISRFVLVMNFFLQAGAYLILSFIENLAIIVNMFVLTLGYPAHVSDFFSSLFPLITFDAVPTDDLYDEYFNFAQVEEKSVSDQFEIVGYGATLIIRNMGSMFLILFLNPIVYLIAKVLICFAPASTRNLVKKKLLRPWALQNLSLNNFIQFFDSNYMVLSLMAMINLKDLRITSEYLFVERLNSAFALTWLILQLAYPVFFCLLYCCKVKRAVPLPNFCELEGAAAKKLKRIYGSESTEWIKNYAYTKDRHRALMNKYGYLLRDLDLARLGKNMSILTVLVKISHKLVTALSIILFLDYPYFTIFAFTQNTLFYTMFIVWNRPYTSAELTNQTIIDQLVNLVVIYHIYTFTEWTDFDQKTMTGNSLIYIFGF
jgi:hypothetical protein